MRKPLAAVCAVTAALLWGCGTLDLAEAPAAGAPFARGASFRDPLPSGGSGPEMVVIPAGSFLMGSPPGEEGRWADEGPVHRVVIAAPFAVGAREVTRGEFGRFAAAVGHSAGYSCVIYEDGEYKDRAGMSWRGPGFSQTDAHPVVCVSWEDAKAYVSWLSRETGHSYRLLTEAEWEYAARAGSATRYSWGNAIGRNRANCRDDLCGDSHQYMSPVGSFASNAFGLHDMHGNVWEWVEDCWNWRYGGTPVDGGARLSGDCSARVLRGGSWYDNPMNLRSAYRSGSAPGDRIYVNGFRVARSLTP